MSIGNNAVCHIAILVKDIHKAAANWAEVLGMDKPEPFFIPGPDTVPNFTRGEATDASDVQLAVFELPNVKIELVQPGSNKNAFSDKMAQDGEGLQHISFVVPDRHAANQSLLGIGAPEAYHIGYWPNGTYAFVDSREQLGIEINIKTDDDNTQKQKLVKADPGAHKNDLV